MKLQKSFLQKAYKTVKAALPFLLAAAVVCATVFFPHPQKAQAENKRIVRIWNVDTFEGGKGSRTSFLKKIARRTEKKYAGVYFMVSDYTVEGASSACLAGEQPDILSFGVGLSVFAEQSLPLPFSHAGGEVGGSCLAYPWCRGEYSLYSLSDDFDEAGETLLSVGGNNLPAVSAALHGVSGEEVDSLSAYVRFLNGECRYLLGTQRDACRFASRGTPVYSKPLTGYNDLYQYISLLSSEKWDDCLAFCTELLSDAAQSELSSIGMYPVKGDESEWTASVFSDANALSALAERAHLQDGLKNPQKYLKNI